MEFLKTQELFVPILIAVILLFLLQGFLCTCIFMMARYIRQTGLSHKPEPFASKESLSAGALPQQKTKEKVSEAKTTVPTGMKQQGKAELEKRRLTEELLKERRELAAKMHEKKLREESESLSKKEETIAFPVVEEVVSVPEVEETAAAKLPEQRDEKLEAMVRLLLEEYLK